MEGETHRGLTRRGMRWVYGMGRQKALPVVLEAATGFLRIWGFLTTGEKGRKPMAEWGRRRLGG